MVLVSGMPSSRIAKAVFYLAAVLVLFEMSATLLSVSRISAELAETKLDLARAEERRSADRDAFASAAAAAPRQPLPPLTATAQLVQAATVIAAPAEISAAHAAAAHGASGAKSLLAEKATPVAVAQKSHLRAEQDAKEATWDRLRLEAGETTTPLEAGKHHNTASYPGARTLDENGATLEDEGEYEDEEEEDLGPPMMDMLWTVLNPPEHNALRTVPPDAEEPKELANGMLSAGLYDALKLDPDEANFTVLDFGSRDGGASLKVARKHPTSTVVSVALSGETDEAVEYRKNETDFQLWVGGEVGATNNLVCQPPTSTTPAMLLWWLYRQPVFFDYALISAHAMEILLEDLLPHELEAVMARAIQLARVVVVEEPDTSSARKYLKHWGDAKTEGLARAAATLGKATALSVKSGGDRTIRVKASFARTVCLAKGDVAGSGLFVAEGQPRLDDDFQDEIDKCSNNQDETCVLTYDREKEDESEQFSVAMRNGTTCVDDRRDLHVSLHMVLQLGLGDAQRRAMLSSALRVDITPTAVIDLAEQYQRTAAAVFVQGAVAFVNKWFEVNVPVTEVAKDADGAADGTAGGGKSGGGGCQLDTEHMQSVAVSHSDSQDPKFTVEHTADAHVAAVLRCNDCECGDNGECKHNSFGDTWELHVETTDSTTETFTVHRVDKDEGWGYDGLSIEYTVCEPKAADESKAADGGGDDGGRRVLQDWGLSDGGWQAPSEDEKKSDDDDKKKEGEPEMEPETAAPVTKSIALHITGDDVSCEDEFDEIWPLIRRHTKFDAVQHPSVLLYGNDHITGLLAAKMARKMPTGTIVAMAGSQPALDAHSTMLSALDIDNALLCHPNGQANDLEPYIGPLVQTPVQISVQYIGSDIFGYAITLSADRFVELVGKAISLSATTYLEIPNPRVLGAWLNMMSRNEEADSFLTRHPYLGGDVEKDVVDWMNGLCGAFVTAGGMEAEKVKVEVMSASGSWGQQQRIVRIDHSGSQVRRSISRPGHERDLLSFSLQNGLWVESTPSSFLASVAGGSAATSFAVQSEFMLSDLLELGLLNGYKDGLFVEYLDIAALSLVDTAEGTPKPSALSVRCAKLTSALKYMTESQLADFCTGEIGLEDLADAGGHEASNANWRSAMNLPVANFSLLTYASDDPGLGGEQIRAAAMDLAGRHPQSSVVSIMPHVGPFTKQLEDKGIINLLPIRNHMDKDLVGRIYRSPEFFQYQMMGNIIHFMHSMGKDDFADFMEKVLSICSTTFFSMPSADLLSAATSLFYGVPDGTFKWAEKKLLLET